MPIIWIASYPKSGNTWLRLFLSHAILGPDRPLAELSAFSPGEAKTSRYRRHLAGAVAQWRDADVMAARAKVHADLAAAGRPHVFVKTHNASASFAGRPLVTPEVTAAAIYIVRNPLDVVLSFADHVGATLDQAIAIMAADYVKPTTERTVLECYGSWSSHVASWTSDGQPGVLVLRYEDLLAEPERHFGRLVRFLDLPLPPGRLAAAIEGSSFARLRGREDREGFNERSPHSQRFFRVGRAGQWQEVLSPDQVAAITARHGAQMRRFGYLPEGG